MNKKLFIGLVLTSFMISTQASAGLFDNLESVGGKPFRAQVGKPFRAQVAVSFKGMEEFIDTINNPSEDKKEIAEKLNTVLKLLQDSPNFKIEDLISVLKNEQDLSPVPAYVSNEENIFFEKGGSITIDDFLEKLLSIIKRRDKVWDPEELFYASMVGGLNKAKEQNEINFKEYLLPVGIHFLKNLVAREFPSEAMTDSQVAQVIQDNPLFFPDIQTTQTQRRSAAGKDALLIPLSEALTYQDLLDKCNRLEKENEDLKEHVIEDDNLFSSLQKYYEDLKKHVIEDYEQSHERARESYSDSPGVPKLFSGEADGESDGETDGAYVSKV